MSSSKQPPGPQPEAQKRPAAGPQGAEQQGQEAEGAAPSASAALRGPLAARDLLRLQRAVGNRAASRLIAPPARPALQERGAPLTPPAQDGAADAPAHVHEATLERTPIQRVAGLKVGVHVEVIDDQGGPPVYGQITAVPNNHSYQVRIGGTDMLEVFPAHRVRYNPDLKAVKDRQLQRELLALDQFLGGRPVLDINAYCTAFRNGGGLNATIVDSANAIQNGGNAGTARETIAMFQYLHEQAAALGGQIAVQLARIDPVTYPDYCRDYLAGFGRRMMPLLNNKSVWAGDDTRDDIVNAPQNAVALFREGKNALLAQGAQVQNANANFTTWLDVIATELNVKSYMRRIYAVRDARFAPFRVTHLMMLMDLEDDPIDDEAQIQAGQTYWIVDNTRRVRYQATFAVAGNQVTVATVNQASAELFRT